VRALVPALATRPRRTSTTSPSRIAPTLADPIPHTRRRTPARRRVFSCPPFLGGPRLFTPLVITPPVFTPPVFTPPLYTPVHSARVHAVGTTAKKPLQTSRTWPRCSPGGHRSQPGAVSRPVRLPSWPLRPPRGHGAQTASAERAQLDSSEGRGPLSPEIRPPARGAGTSPAGRPRDASKCRVLPAERNRNAR
jgi:hypothetical protein